MTSQGWSAEMDRKLREMRRNPDDYFAKARKQARESSSPWASRPKKEAS